ncbi:molybdopterin-dependent oxidoreductase [Streptomyces sp. NBC_01016]|uniref:molybdopterin-dependent oxidoreductase n=1 Tax=Streptomyces sp. NBC_01016 TaxID=2903720 RepID=UPI002252372A|nr:molybdopterin-dependent oxidoreductase [Streptomyces sp. NBC_01016]MCX4830848.1 molybdopterin-dependent oxidoreductase [Streptomyces sp. NBC_01016]
MTAEGSERRGTRLRRAVRGAVAGCVAGGAALAAAEPVAAVVRPQTAPLTVVGGAAIDRAPTPVKEWAIRTFGTDDKPMLQLGIVAVLLVLACALGVVAVRHRRAGSAGVLLIGLVGAAAALTRPDAAGPLDTLPSLVAAVVGALVLYWLSGLAARDRAADVVLAAPTDEAAPAPAPRNLLARRPFLLAVGGTAVGSVAIGALGRGLAGSRGSGARASREALTLPAPTSPAPPVPKGTRLRIPGISPFRTPNSDFYRVDTALVVPEVDAGTWRLRLHGKGVARPVTFTLDDLLGRDLIERDITLTCVSNEVGGPYAGNARWLGVPLAALLRGVGVRPPQEGGPADQLVARSVDGMTIGTPVDDVMDGRDALLAVGMNGQPLPFAHGFPVRMVVPGLFGYVSACKWLTDLELTTFDAYDPYWVRRKWARRAPIKTQARIDTPKPFAHPKTGTVMVAGVAWAQHRGIDKVEVRVDDGPWEAAELAAEDSRDTWRQWSYAWRATKGGHNLTVRATDRTGDVQTAQRAGTFPDGASGRHTVVVTVD